MTVIVMIFRTVAAFMVVRWLEVIQVIDLFGGHQTLWRIANTSEVLRSWLEIQLRQHAVAAWIVVLFVNHGVFIRQVAKRNGSGWAS